MIDINISKDDSKKHCYRIDCVECEKENAIAYSKSPVEDEMESNGYAEVVCSNCRSEYTAENQTGHFSEWFWDVVSGVCE